MVAHGNDDRGKARVPAHVARRRPPPSLLTLAVVGLAGVLLLGSALALYFWLTTPSTDASSRTFDRSAAEQKADQERLARNARVCELARQRVLHGATLGVTETDGWVVELLGLRLNTTESPTESPALRAFLEDPAAPSGTSFIWKEEPLTPTVPSSFARVTVSSETISGSEGQRVPGLRVTFHGPLVDPYFDTEQRQRYYHIADGLTRALGLSHAALYARCEDASTLQQGSWFFGPDEAGAASALLYSLGTYSEPPQLAPQFMHGVGNTTLDRALAFSNIQSRTALLDRPLLVKVVGLQGGIVTGKKGSGVTITFPFRDGSRALRSSREVARFVGLRGDVD